MPGKNDGLLHDIIRKAKQNLDPKAEQEVFGVIEHGDVDFVPNEDDLALDLVLDMDFDTCCPNCAHYQGSSGGTQPASTCKAFPKGIPDAILSGARTHTTPEQGDNGVVFKPKV